MTDKCCLKCGKSRVRELGDVLVAGRGSHVLNYGGVQRCRALCLRRPPRTAHHCAPPPRTPRTAACRLSLWQQSFLSVGEKPALEDSSWLSTHISSCNPFLFVFLSSISRFIHESWRSSYNTLFFIY